MTDAPKQQVKKPQRKRKKVKLIPPVMDTLGEVLGMIGKGWVIPEGKVVSTVAPNDPTLPLIVHPDGRVDAIVDPEFDPVPFKSAPKALGPSLSTLKKPPVPAEGSKVKTKKKPRGLKVGTERNVNGFMSIWTGTKWKRKFPGTTR